jgi:hypothetical protein
MEAKQEIGEEGSEQSEMQRDSRKDQVSAIVRKSDRWIKLFRVESLFPVDALRIGPIHLCAHRISHRAPYKIVGSCFLKHPSMFNGLSVCTLLLLYWFEISVL